MTEVEKQIKKILDDCPEVNRRILELQLETLVIKAKREQMKEDHKSTIKTWRIEGNIGGDLNNPFPLKGEK
jgi:hypothetical protein